MMAGNSIEHKISRAIAELAECCGRPDGTKCTIGVGYVGWGELVGLDEDVEEVTVREFGRKYKVVPVEGLQDGQVAIIF
jgi:hypothetical protein